MNKNVYLIGLLLILSISLVSAKDDGKSSKQLVEIFDCFNVTVKYSLTDGNTTPIYFDGCSDKGSNTWFCDCKGYTNGFNLTMRTDRSILRDPREYDISIDYVLYNFYSNSDDFEVEDWGDYVEVNGESIKYTNSSTKCKNSVDIIYINKTVEVIEYRNRTVEVPVYLENTSKIDECNVRMNDLLLLANDFRFNNSILSDNLNSVSLINDSLKRQRNHARTWAWLEAITLLIVIIWIFYEYNRKE